ncbi:MAG: hypothetical protein KME40_10405 [Komarekiella atlantica HA4396-MV6]|nr:hypothetical protein [Komarekiella atlantica HA4396-MV6]
MKSDQAVVLRSLNDNTRLEINNWSYAMHIQRMGFLYNLYCIGWKNGSLKHLSFLQHGLFSIFLYYRRGYTEGSQWRQDCLRDPSSSRFL